MKIFLLKILPIFFIIFCCNFLLGFSPANEVLKSENTRQENIIQMENLMEKSSPENCINFIENHNMADSVNYIVYKNRINEILQNYKEKLIADVNNLSNTNINVSVNKLLDIASKYYENDSIVTHLENINNKLNNEKNVEKYEGSIETLNFNTLIAFPNKVFDTGIPESEINDEKLTVEEFSAILNELHKNNYILVDIFDVISCDKNTRKNTLMIPKNKKPIILTFDNVSYVSNYQNQGSIDKIIIDRNNNLATYTTKKSIQDRISYDNEFIVILEKFIKSHPDFSHNGARGIIFFTGENGILGYNTNHKNAGYKHEAKRVSEVIKKLKSLGWKFGCNNYTYISEDTKSDMEFAKELSLWNKEIGTLIGETPLYAHPYGIANQSDLQKELLIENGFQVFFTNNTNPDIKIHGDICTIQRREINAKVLRESKEELSHLFDAEKIYDHNARTTFYNLN